MPCWETWKLAHPPRKACLDGTHGIRHRVGVVRADQIPVPDRRTGGRSRNRRRGHRRSRQKDRPPPPAPRIGDPRRVVAGRVAAPRKKSRAGYLGHDSIRGARAGRLAGDDSTTTALSRLLPQVAIFSRALRRHFKARIPLYPAKRPLRSILRPFEGGRRGPTPEKRGVGGDFTRFRGGSEGFAGRGDSDNRV